MTAASRHRGSRPRERSSQDGNLSGTASVYHPSQSTTLGRVRFFGSVRRGGNQNEKSNDRSRFPDPGNGGAYPRPPRDRESHAREDGGADRRFDRGVYRVRGGRPRPELRVPLPLRRGALGQRHRHHRGLQPDLEVLHRHQSRRRAADRARARHDLLQHGVRLPQPDRRTALRRQHLFRRGAEQADRTDDPRGTGMRPRDRRAASRAGRGAPRSPELRR